MREGDMQTSDSTDCDNSNPGTVWLNTQFVISINVSVQKAVVSGMCSVSCLEYINSDFSGDIDCCMFECAIYAMVQ